MSLSIRTKLFLSVSSLILFFVLFSLFLNSQYLEKYYIWHKKATLLEIKDKINDTYKGNPDTISNELENLERNRGITIYILDQNFAMKYNSSFRLFEDDLGRRAIQMPTRLPLNPVIEQKILSFSKGESFTDVSVDPRLKTKFLVMASRLSNNETLILTTPIVAISENTDIANRFFMLTGLITILLGGTAIYFFATKYTRPILEMNQIAQEMSRLNFSIKYPVKTDDEVGQLGKSLNSLSDQLDKAISELTEANSKLIEDIERERKIDKMRKEFVSNVSHELKTPIALIQGYAEGLKLNVIEDEENKNFYCDVIMDEANKMNVLVKDLLDLSQIESGYFRIEKTAFEPHAMIQHVIERFRHIFNEKEIRPQIEIQGKETVVGDIVRMEQVLVNYLSNALNHVNEDKIIKLLLMHKGSKIRISVFNSGNPIPEESLDKIWTSFYKVDKARTREYGGTGLGLSVVKAIMELHHNAYGVINKDGGVEFWFDLDIEQNN